MWVKKSVFVCFTNFKEFIRKMGWSISKEHVQEKVVDKNNESEIPADIMSLVGIASSISEDDIKNDDRLSCLLRDSNKK